MQKLIYKMAQIHDKLCQIFFKINRYAAMPVIFLIELLIVEYLERYFFHIFDAF